MMIRKLPTLNRDLIEYQILKGGRSARGDISGLTAQGKACSKTSRHASIDKTRIGVFSKTITSPNNAF